MFADVVELYRCCGRPPIANGVFSYEGPADDGLRQVIAKCLHLAPHFGRFSDPPETDADGDVTFEWSLAANESARFYDSVVALAEGSAWPSQGIAAAAYYIRDLDYFVGEGPEPQGVNHLNQLAALVCELAKITQVVKGGPADPLKLLFVIPADEKAPPKTVQLITRVSPQLLDLLVPDLRPLRALTAIGDDVGFHQEERRALFRLAVADVLGETGQGSADLAHLVEHWPRVLAKYQYDADAYISRFSFDKVRKEISRAELDVVTQLHSVAGDSATKLLGLPLSLAAVIGVHHAASFLEALMLCLGALLISVLFSGFTENQRLHLARIRDAFNVVFDPLAEKLESYPESIKQNLCAATNGFAKQMRFSRRILTTFRILSWMPTLLAVGALAYRYDDTFRLWLISHIDRYFL